MEKAYFNKFWNFSCAILISWSSALISCSTATYRFSSNPSEAEVFLVSKNGEKKPLGKTPLSVNANEINSGKDSVMIEVKKEGYLPQQLFIGDSYFAKNVESSMVLAPQATAADTKNQDASMNEIASSVADIQRDIQTKNYDIALTKLSRMQASYPNVATFHSLMGNVHYLEKRLDKSLQSYKKAIALNPNLYEVQKMIEKIEALSGGGTR